MAEEHHDDHGNTPAGWFLTISWIVVWSVAAVAILAGQSVIVWTAVALAASVVCAVVAGVMKRAGLGRTTPRPVPMTRAEYEALMAESTESAQATAGTDKATTA